MLPYSLYSTPSSTDSGAAPTPGRLGQSGSAKAFLDLVTPGTNIDTVIEAVDGGTVGNLITITFVDGSALDDGALSRIGTAFTFAFKTTVTTVADFEAAVGALTGDDALIQVKTIGTPTNALVTTDDEFAATPLASGGGSHYSASWRGMGDFGLTVVTDGTLTGTWTLWASDKPNASLTDDTDWVDTSTHAEFAETNPAGAATKWRVNSTLLRAAQFRLKYVNTSGLGTINAYVATL
jgi:hypothetical protein